MIASTQMMRPRSALCNCTARNQYTTEGDLVTTTAEAGGVNRFDAIKFHSYGFANNAVPVPQLSRGITELSRGVTEILWFDWH
jgi:hypothetical protein